MTTASTPFLRGFRSLPDELKLLILRYITYNPAAITRDVWLGDSDPHIPSYPDTYQSKLVKETVVPLLSVPEIKGLILEAFYGVNRMLVFDNSICQPEESILPCPPPSVTPLVRHLEIKLDYEITQYFDFLKGLADGTKGLKNLHHLTVSIDPDSIVWMASEKRLKGKAYFEGFDRIELPMRHLTIESIANGDGDSEIDIVELLWFDKLDLKANGTREERWQRFFSFYAVGADDRSEYIMERSKFVTRSGNGSEWRTQVRVTIKTVSIQSKDLPYGRHRWADRPVRK